MRPLLGGDHARATRRLTDLVLRLDAAAGGAAALVGLLRLRRARRGARPALAAAALAGIALAAYAVALLLEPAESPRRPLYEWLFAARSLALVSLAAALAWLALRPRLVRGRVTRLAVDLERTAAGGLGVRLARALGDAGLRRRLSDRRPGRRRRRPPARPRPVEARDAGRRSAASATALVESDVLGPDALERELGPAAQLALANERLRAEALARLEDVRASRARIVETADAARRRIERDLHDGAQQRMLALTYDLRVALTIAEAGPDESVAEPLREALARAESASRELRDVAHGIFPAELATSGLAGALESLADLWPLRLAVELPPGRRLPARHRGGRVRGRRRGRRGRRRPRGDRLGGGRGSPRRRRGRRRLGRPAPPRRGPRRRGRRLGARLRPEARRDVQRLTETCAYPVVSVDES